MTGKTTIVGVISKALEEAGYFVAVKPCDNLSSEYHAPDPLMARETAIYIEERQAPRVS